MITDEQFNNLKIGDFFWSVIQKDNNPFEKPFIWKFIITDFQYWEDKLYIISNKHSRDGRRMVFCEKNIHLTYEDALVEKKEIREKIKKWEIERKEKDRIYFAEQDARERQRQEEHENQIRKEERKSVCNKLRNWCKENFDYNKLPNELGCWVAVNREEFFVILDKIENQGDDTNV